MAAPLRILVVGLGNMGASHASAYHRNPGFHIVGLCSRSIKSKAIPEDLRGYPLFDNYEAALADLNRIGVNLNQLARRANASGKIPLHLADVLAEVRAAVERIAERGA